MRVVAAIILLTVACDSAVSQPIEDVPKDFVRENIQEQSFGPPAGPDAASITTPGAVMENVCFDATRGNVLCGDGGALGLPPSSIQSPQSTRFPASTTPPLRLNEDVKDPKNFSTMTPPSSAPPAKNAPARPGLVTAPSTFATTTQSAILRAPGGIALSKAAASRMPLNISIEGLLYANGRIILSGAKNASTSIDAALFLTSLRLACGDQDPYFSLDPDNGAAWQEQTDKAGEELWARIQRDHPVKPNTKRKSDVFTLRTISSRRDYPNLWKDFESKYPGLRAALVFKPGWLRETRFGEILYKADVLLKELSHGIPALDGLSLPARNVAAYVSASERRVASRLLDFSSAGQTALPSFEGSRLWFDLTSYVPLGAGPRPIDMLLPVAADICDARCQREQRKSAALRKILVSKGLLAPSVPATVARRPLAADGNAIDLSGIYPKMFVRRHDHRTGTDIPGSSPPLDKLSEDVNGRIDRYAARYPELQSLIEIFRAYVAAVRLTQIEKAVCTPLQSLQLTAEEKVAAPLPKYHRTEVSATIATYEFSNGRSRNLMTSSVRSYSGGVHVRGRTLVNHEMQTGVATPVTRLLSSAQSQMRPDVVVWSDEGDRRYVALSLDLPGAQVASLAAPPTERAPASRDPSPKAPVANVVPHQLRAQLPLSQPNANGRATGTAVANNTVGLLPMIGALILTLGMTGWFFVVRRPVATANIPNSNGRYANGAWAMPDRSQRAAPPTVKTTEPKPTLDVVERRFNSIFAMKSRTDRERMIKGNREVKGGTRQQAMQRLIDEFDRDNRSWR